MDRRGLPLSGYDRKLAEEVMFLHSLWRQGPPPNRTRSRNPTLGADLRDPGALPPRDVRKRRRKKRTRGEVASDLTADVQPSESSGLPWPVEELPPPSTEWPPEKKLRPAPEPAPPPTPEEQAKVDAAIARQKALKASQLFFEELYKEDEEGSEEDVDEEAIEFEDDLEKLNIYTFFIDIFTKDPILRQHYENSESGEFNCLACAGIGMKGLKKYNNSVAILQHAHFTVTAKRKKGHRAFARALCKVLGYNFNMLPSLVLDAGERLGESLAKDAKAQKEDGIEEENQEHVVEEENQEHVVEEENQEHVFEKQENEDAVEEENIEDVEENIEDDAEEENMEDDAEEENMEVDAEEENMEDDVEEENTEDDAEEENIEDDVEEENIEGSVEKAENKEDVYQAGNKDAIEEENIEDPAEDGEDIFEEVENKDAAEHENTENSVGKGENIDAIEDENPPENITNNLTENPLESSFQ